METRSFFQAFSVLTSSKVFGTELASFTESVHVPKLNFAWKLIFDHAKEPKMSRLPYYYHNKTVAAGS